MSQRIKPKIVEKKKKMEEKMKGKCRHGRPKDLCCECRYGKIRKESSKVYDLVDELKSPAGYKLAKGHFGDIKIKE